MRCVASVTICNAFFIRTRPIFLGVELTVVEYYIVRYVQVRSALNLNKVGGKVLIDNSVPHSDWRDRCDLWMI